jgi:hypothetical protein
MKFDQLLGLLRMVFAPKALHHIAQGCRAAATLGKDGPRCVPRRGSIGVQFARYATP